MVIVLLAAVSMLIQDILAVLLVQAEARNKATLSAILDCLMWPAGMACTAISVTALQGHDLGLKAGVIVGVEIANLTGSYVAIGIGKRYIKENKETAACACGCPVPARQEGTQ